MSQLQIDISQVRQLNEELNRLDRRLSEVRQQIQMNIYRVDPRIAARRGIGPRLNQTQAQVQQMAYKLRQLAAFIQYAMDHYSAADDRAKRGPDTQLAVGMHAGKSGYGLLDGFRSVWKETTSLAERAWDQVEQIGEEVVWAADTSWNSFVEIGTDMWDAAERRADKAFDSPQDFFNWITVGMPDKFEGMIEGERSRYAKRTDSVYDYFNWLTNGSVETAKEAFDPDEPLSKEHWMASFGLLMMLFGGTRASQRGSAPKPAEKPKTPGAEGMGKVDNALPNLESAKIDPRKLTDYALNPEHPVGGNKAKVFESALGYSKSNADDLMKRVQEKLPQSEAVLGKADQYGQRYTVDMQITGPNGNTTTVRTGWIVKPDSDAPEMTTIYVK